MEKLQLKAVAQIKMSITSFFHSGTDSKIQTDGCDDDDENRDRAAAGYYAEGRRDQCEREMA